MKHLTTAAVCVIVLYFVDALCFGGWYLGATAQAIERAYALNW